MMSAWPDAPTDPGASLQLALTGLQQSLVDTERNRVAARQLEIADEMVALRIRNEQYARQTAFNDSMIEDMAQRPEALPAQLAPQMVSVTNVQNVHNLAAPNYVTNLQNNIYQTTQNLHQNTLNFISNTSNRIINMGGSLADAFNNLQEPLPLLAFVNGRGPPPPPAPPGGSRVQAIQDRSYGPALAIRDRPSPYQSKEATEPLALKDKVSWS